LARNHAIRRWIILVLLGSLFGCVTANSVSVVPGNYRLAEKPDLAGQLILSADGRFGCALTAGALGERAQGGWEKDGSAICLFTEPRPVAPEFSRGPRDWGKDESRRLLVHSPDGNGIPGIDIRLGLDDGSVIENYTQHDWLDGGARRSQRCRFAGRLPQAGGKRLCADAEGWDNVV
jgi:hypothetical protein